MVKPIIGNVIKPVMSLVKKPSQKAGLPPGTPVFVGEKKTREVKITIFDYDEKGFEFVEAKSAKDCFPFKDKPTVSWINVEGLHEVAVIDELCSHFGVHPLTVEDILNTTHRPKFEVFDDYAFIVVKIPSFDEETLSLEREQVCLVLGRDFVLSFQEESGEAFDPVRARIKGRGRIAKHGADYLAYALMDTMVDTYFNVLERLDEILEELEEEVLSSPTQQTLENIHSLKRAIIQFRRAAWPLREVVSGFEKVESPLLRDSTTLYLRDLYDHAIQVVETLDAQRDITTGLVDAYLSGVSNRLNDVMKVLTIFASIFIPLTFVAGIYGMNFRYMPELDWKFGYFGALGAMAAIGLSLLAYFKRKNWL
jgi:magnesium transporter